jgi:prevent-host-death family protein
MKTYSTSELARAIGDVTHAAGEEPVLITHHAKPRFVLMTVSEYERLAGSREDPRRAYRSGEAPKALAALLLKAVDQEIAELDATDGD